MYKDKISIQQKLQKRVVQWYHTYLLHTELDITEELIHQKFYWPGLREVFQMEATGCDTRQCKNGQQTITVIYLLRYQKKHNGIKYV